jgi:hypothetical protein
MRLLVLHQNFPGQFGHLVKAWQQRPGWDAPCAGRTTLTFTFGRCVPGYDDLIARSCANGVRIAMHIPLPLRNGRQRKKGRARHDTFDCVGIASWTEAVARFRGNTGTQIRLERPSMTVTEEADQAARHLNRQQEHPVAFVNEIVSEEDIKKYGLDELKKHYNSFSWRDGRPATFTHTWTIDRERGIFALPLFTWTQVGQSGRSQPTSKESWLIEVQGKRVIAVVDRAHGSSVLLSDSPYQIIWDLIDVDMADAPGLRQQDVLQMLKEALIAYGHMGIYLQANNTVVSFNF